MEERSVAAPASSSPEPSAFLTPAVTEPPLISVPLWKVAFLSAITFGFYQIVWHFRHWRQQRTIEVCSPFWRAVFGVLFFAPLANRAKQRRLAAGLSGGITVAPLALCYFLFQIVWRLPDPWWLGGNLSFLPLLPVQHAVNDLNRRMGVPFGRSWTLKTITAIVLGTLFWLMVLLGLLLPEP